MSLKFWFSKFSMKSEENQTISNPTFHLPFISWHRSARPLQSERTVCTRANRLSCKHRPQVKVSDIGIKPGPGKSEIRQRWTIIDYRQLCLEIVIKGLWLRPSCVEMTCVAINVNMLRVNLYRSSLASFQLKEFDFLRSVTSQNRKKGSLTFLSANLIEHLNTE